MKIVKELISIQEIDKIAKEGFGLLVKAVVDTEMEIMAIDADMHADEELLLLESGSKQKNLWGINLYPAEFGKVGFIEFDSMINLRPTQNNLSRGVEDEKIREKIEFIVKKLIKP